MTSTEDPQTTTAADSAEAAPVSVDEVTIAATESSTDTQPPVAKTQANGHQVNAAAEANPTSEPSMSNGSPTQTGAMQKTQNKDKYFETDDRITWVKDGAVSLRFKDSGMESLPAMTIMSMFQSTVKRYPQHKALGFKVGDEWNFLTYQEYYNQVWAAAKSFIKVGLETFNGVGILGFNSKEWFISHFGAIFAGGLSAGIYTTNSAEAVAYVLNSCHANVCVVENDVQLQKVLTVWSDLPNLKVVVQYVGKPNTDKENVYSWEEFLKLGQDVDDAAVQERIDGQYVNKCCSLIYTSGTTGTPKGVMLSHDNVTYEAMAICKWTEIRLATETLISYLPLSHVAAQLLDMYAPICYAATVYFAQPDALKGTLNNTMKEVLPTIFFGVPRVYEKMEDKIKIALKDITGIKRKLVDWSRGVATKTAENMQKGAGPAFGNSIANKIFKNVRGALGLTNCRWLYSGAAPLAESTHNFFASIGLPVMEVYGMSESTGATSMSSWTPNHKYWKPGSAGHRINGVGFDIVDPDEKGHGEIAMVGRHVFMGYLGEENKTKETFDSEFRLRSGDVGFVDPDGFLFISGRIKELLITAGGENVAPVPIEDCVKEVLPVVSNCMLVGDRRKFLSLLIALKTEVDMETMKPTEKFTQQTIEWCQSIGSSATTVPEVLDGKDEAVTKAIKAGIDQVNKKSESNAKRIAKFTILPEDFSIGGGELGPTLKLKRPVVTEKYAELIESMYTGTD